MESLVILILHMKKLWLREVNKSCKKSHCYKVLRVKILLLVCLASGFCDLNNYAILSHRTPLDITCDYN